MVYEVYEIQTLGKLYICFMGYIKQNVSHILLDDDTRLAGGNKMSRNVENIVVNTSSKINIEETVSCYTETIIVLQIEDAGKALTILTDLITRSRESLKQN